MADRIKGITVEIGGDTQGLSKALSNVNKNIRTTESSLKDVERLLKLDPNNTELLAQKQRLLGNEIESVGDKLKALKSAQSQVESQFGKGEIGIDKVEALKREIIETETKLNSLKTKSQQTASAMTGNFSDIAQKTEKTKNSINDVTDKTEKLKNVVSGVGTVFKGIGASVAAGIGAVTGGVAAINNIAESTREYREDIGKLETAFETAGISQEIATETYKSFYSVLGEEDRSVEAVNHLAKLTQSQEDLQKWTNICAGVWGTFGDSLPIEGLTEAANETAKVGEVTGPLADALNWAGISEDKFNESLAKCNTEQERATLITDTLNGLYKDAAENYKTANGEIMNAQRAQSELTDATAKLGDALEPVSTSFKYLGANIVNDIAPGVDAIGEGLTAAFDGSENAGEKIGEGMTSILESLLNNIEQMLPIVANMLITIIPGLLESIIVFLPQIGALGVDILLALVTGIVSNLPSLLQAAIDIIIYLANSISIALPELIPTIVDVVIKIAEILTDPANLQNLIMAALQIILALATGLIQALPKLIDSVPSIITNIVKTLIKLLPQIVNVSIQILTTLASGLTRNIGKLISVVPNLINQLFKAFTNTDFVKRAKEWGKDFVQGLIDGIRSMISKVGDAAKSIADKITSFLHFSRPDEGPLHYYEAWMPDFIDGLTNGIYKNLPKIEEAAKSVAGILDMSTIIVNPQVFDYVRLANAISSAYPERQIVLNGRVVGRELKKV